MAKLEISRVHDAYGAGGECPLCTLAAKAEQALAASFRSSRGMQPDVRVQTNEKGFCPAHLAMLHAGEGKLGLALVVHTHLVHSLPGLRAVLEGTREAAAMGRKGEAKLDSLAADLEARRDSCYICDRLATELEHFAFTILYLWQKDPAFPATLKASRGFCLTHFLHMLSAARRTLRGDGLSRWLTDVVPLMTAGLESLGKDLHAFTQLHQGASGGLGTDKERTALSRALQKLSGSRRALRAEVGGQR